MNRRKIGMEMEDKAAEYLRENGYDILERNYRCPTAELDIVASEAGYLCFIEVKYRKGKKYGGIEGTISTGKIKKISQCARYYMAEKGVSTDAPVRFDVIFIVADEISLLKNAFSYKI